MHIYLASLNLVWQCFLCCLVHLAYGWTLHLISEMSFLLSLWQMSYNSSLKILIPCIVLPPSFQSQLSWILLCLIRIYNYSLILSFLFPRLSTFIFSLLLYLIIWEPLGLEVSIFYHTSHFLPSLGFSKLSLPFGSKSLSQSPWQRYYDICILNRGIWMDTG